MSDLEGLVNILLDRGFHESDIKIKLVDEILTFKSDISKVKAEKIADAVLKEVLRSRSVKQVKNKVLHELVDYPKSNVSMGVMGVGSRGEGDIFVHKLIAKLASLGGLNPFLGPLSLDDAGMVSVGDLIVAVSVDGTHSRLSNFPFLAGFHVTRACLRDVYVKGAKPIALFDDIHLADDGDIGKLFDFVVGINVVSSLIRVPLVAGSTLRVGGDMVIGERMVSCVGAVGIVKAKHNVTAKRNVKPGDVILMSEGAGGGTITTSAIYSGNFDVILETLNLRFLEICDFLLESNLISKIHSMTDVTNGGIRGDANTICKEAGVGLVIDGKIVEEMVNEKVLEMLKHQSIDPLGVSLDSLLMFVPENFSEEIRSQIRKLGVKVEPVGYVVDKPKKAKIIVDGKLLDLKPKFRESAYTEVKKVVGERSPANKVELEKAVKKAFYNSIKKRNFFMEIVKRSMLKNSRIGEAGYSG
ncbi:MAG: AIR synthase-related protein [Candidatus Bathyarchaeota archaeon]